MEPVELCESCAAKVRTKAAELLEGNRWTPNTVAALYVPEKPAIPLGMEILDVDDAEAEFGKMLYQTR